MAKKKNLEVSDHNSVDDHLGEFNFEDFNFDAVEQKDDRHPVIKALSPIGKGLKSYVGEQSNIEKFVKASLPRGYGQIQELGLETASELKELYNSAKEELKPVGQMAKSIIGSALPKIGDKLPEGLRKRLEEFSKPEQNWQSSRQESNDEKLAGLLAEVFDTRAKERSEEQTAYVEKENVRQGFEQVRHSDSMGQLSLTRQAAESLVQYQNKITFNYQKKSLELKYRSFWALTELVRGQKEGNAALVTELRAAVKNTGLPEFVKIKNSERFREIVRNKFLDNTRESMFGGAQNYVRRFSRNLRDQATRTLAGVGQIASAAQSGASMLDSADMSPEMRREMATAELMRIPLDYLSEKGAKALGKITGKNSAIRRTGFKLQNFADSVGDRLHESLNSVDKDWGSLEALREALRNAAPNAAGDAQLETDALHRSHEPLPFSRSNSKSINEIIPGMLARIHQELRIIRTGEETNDLLTYDFSKNRFTTERTLGAKLKANIAGRHGERMRESVSGMLDTVDKGGKLTAEQRAIAERGIIERSVNGKSMDVSTIGTAMDWGGGENGAAIAAAFNRFLRAEGGKLGRSGKSAERQIKLTRDFRTLSSSLGDPRVEAQMLVNAGQLGVLQNSGLVDETNSLSRETLVDILLGKEAGVKYRGSADGESKTTTAPNTIMPAVVTPGVVAQATTVKSGYRKMRKPGESVAPSQVKSASAGIRESIPGMGLLSRYSEQTVEELRSLREALLSEKPSSTTADTDKTPSTTASIDDSDLAKNVKSIEEAILRLEEAYGGSSKIQGTWIGGIAKKMGVSSEDGRFSSLWEYTKDRTGKAKRTVSVLGKRAWRTKVVPSTLWAGRKASEASSIAAEKFEEVKNKLSAYYGDVFVKGEHIPRLRASVLKAGGYYDAATGRVINSLNDIAGDVLDASGNLVLSFEEYASAYVGGSINKSIKELFGNLRARVGSIMDRLSNLVPDGVLRAKNALLNIGNKIKELIPPYDVYVTGTMDKPVLYAAVMRYNAYFSQKTSKPITHPRLIDGPVVDKDGNVVLSWEQLQKGIVDIDGVPAGPRGLTRVFAKGMNFAKKAWGKLRESGAKAMGIIGQYLGEFGDFFKNIFTPFTDVITNSKKTVEWLERIHALLDARMPGKKVFGDADGDGDRDGSLLDIKKKREEEKDKKKSPDEEGEKDPNSKKSLLATLIAGVTGLFKKKKGKDDEGDEEDDEDGFGLDDAADIADIADSAGDANERRKNGSSRKDRRRLAKKRLKRMRAPKTTPNGATGRAASRLGKIARAGMSTAPGRFVARAGVSAAGAVAGAAGMAGTGLAAAAPLALRGVGMLFSWPATVAITAGYLGYKAYQYAKKTKATDLSNLRLVQYGIKPDDSVNAEKLWRLEQLLEKHLLGTGDNLALDMKTLPQHEVAQLMALAPGDARAFSDYFNKRFTPVFVYWIRQVHKYKEGGKIGNIESIVPAKDKWNVARASLQETGDAMGYMHGWAAAYSRLATGVQDAENFLDSIRTSLQRQGEKDGGEKAVAAQNTASTTQQKTADDQAASAMKQRDLYQVKDKEGKDVDLNSTTVTELADRIRRGEVGVMVALNVPKVLQHNNTLNQVDALTAVRMKAYGLTEMRLNRVQQLGALERYMSDHLEGSLDSPVANVKTDQALKECAEIFGVASFDGQHGNRWKFWFNGRFLPVFLLYAGTVRRKTKKEDLVAGAREFSTGDQLILARAIVATTGVSPLGGRVSVWKIPSNPWNDDMPMNDNPDSTAGNIESIRLLADKVALGEVSARVAANAETDESKAAFGWYRNARQSHGKKVGSDGSQQSVAGRGIYASGEKIVNDVTNSGAIAPTGQGLTFGSVQGGAYAKMPEMQGSGWGAAKGLIVAAAKATGVDARALASIIGQESSFDPNASPSGYGMPSSAKGLGQHLDGSWNEDMQKHAQELGIPAGTRQYDPKASALLTAMRMRRNGMELEKLLGRKPSTGEVYMAHLMGATGASSVLKMKPNEIAASSESGTNAKKQHPEYFYDRRSQRPFTVAESVNYINTKLENKLKQFNVAEGDLSGARQGADMAAGGTNAPAAAPEQVQMARADKGLSPVLPPKQAAISTALPSPALNQPIVADTSVKAVTKPTGTPMVGSGKASDFELVLEREDSEEDGTYGTLRLPDGTTFMVLELPWRDNQPRISCIPPGTYKCRQRSTRNFGASYEVEGVPRRSAILIHAGNAAGSSDKGLKADSQGCILLGMGRARMGKQKVITSSKQAMQLFHEKMAGRPFTLAVRPSKNAAAGVSPDAGVNFSQMRDNGAPATSPTISAPAAAPAPATTAQTPASSGYSQQASGNPVPPTSASGQALPRLSKPSTDIPMRSQPTTQEMIARDDALTKVIAPKVDGIQGTLSDSLGELRKIVSLLEKSAGQKTSNEVPSVVRPSASPAAAVSQRRGL